MKIIKKLTDLINCELSEAEMYVKLASEMKNIDKLVFETALEIAPQEMHHAELWHECVVKEIDKIKETRKLNDEMVPQYMIEMWQEEHAKYIKRYGVLKYELDLLKK